MSDRFETVAWVYDQGDLALILSRLEHEDIWVLPFASRHASVEWNLTVALGGVQVRVHEEDAAAARALFAEADWVPARLSLFFDNRLIEIVMILLVFGLVLGAPPARLLPEFAVERRDRTI